MERERWLRTSAAVVAAAALTACAERSVDRVGAAPVTARAQPSASATPFTAGDDPCRLVSEAKMGELLGETVESYGFRVGFYLAGTDTDGIPAAQCAYVPAVASSESAAALGVRGISIREGRRDVDELTRALGRYDTPALEELKTSPLPGTKAYWQSIGTTLWVIEEDRVLSIAIDTEVVTDAPRTLATRIAALVLSTE